MKNFKELRQNFRQSMGEELETMHNLNNEAFESSSEGEYWKMRSKKSQKKSQSCQKFKSIRNLKNSRRKKNCHGDKFKTAKKWYGYDGKYFDYDAFEYVIMDKVNHFSQKNRVFCRCCGKSKFVFTSEKKADNFILYNAENIQKINGYSPIRSYYCWACGGWHTTHREKLSEEELGAMISEETLASYPDILLPETEEVETPSESPVAREVEMESKGDILNEEEAEINSEAEECISVEDEKKELVAQIEKIFEGQMAEFDKAFEARDAKECIKLNARLRRIFNSIDIQCQEMTAFYSRLDSMSQKIKELQQQLKDEEIMLMKEIWNIQQIFNSQIKDFTIKFGLGMYQECWNIYNRLSEAIHSFPLKMSFLHEFRRKLKMMHTRLSGCGFMERVSA